MISLTHAVCKEDHLSFYMSHLQILKFDPIHFIHCVTFSIRSKFIFNTNISKRQVVLHIRSTSFRIFIVQAVCILRNRKTTEHQNTFLLSLQKKQKKHAVWNFFLPFIPPQSFSTFHIHITIGVEFSLSLSLSLSLSSNIKLIKQLLLWMSKHMSQFV